MATISASFSDIAGTEAAVGRSGKHVLVADRPEGRAGGLGLGFNGGQLLALALGGCMSNDLRYAAHELGVSLGMLSVEVELNLDGEPLVVSDARMVVPCETVDGVDPARVIERAIANCTVANTLGRGVPVKIRKG